MSTQDQNTEATQKLNSLKAELDTAVAKLRARRNATLGVLVLLALVTAGYLSFVYTRLAKVDAPTVVEMAASQIEPKLDGASGKLSEALKAKAPELVSEVEKALMALPDQLTAQGRTKLNQTFRENLPVIEEELYKTLRDLIVAAKTKAIDEGINPDDPASFDRIVANVAPMIHDEATKAIDGFYQKYTNSAQELVAYMQQLGENKNLDARAQLHREIVSLTLALMAKHSDAKTMPVSAQVETH
jgi:hypothetical protein